MTRSILVHNTPVEDHMADYGLLVKREDLSCPAPGPPFSKTRGVLAWARRAYGAGARTFGVLDTAHSQGGWAVAHACSVIGARCLNWYPVYKHAPGGLRPYQQRAAELGAELRPLPAGRSAVLYHQARRACEAEGGVMFPNALKLDTMVEETAAEVAATLYSAPWPYLEWMHRSPWVVSASSATIASGVARGLCRFWADPPPVVVHMGYSRSEEAIGRYVARSAACEGVSLEGLRLEVIDEGYEYKDRARPGPTPPWPCNEYYDLKAFRWWVRAGRARDGHAVLWNVG